jgi:hypothetical protein
LSTHASLKQDGQRQSPPSERLKIGGYSLHQHLFSTEISPQLKVDSQLEQTLVFVVFINIKDNFVEICKNKGKQKI